MGRKGSSKGISPLIAAVLLIAFTMAVAGMFGQWAPNLIQDIQQDTSQNAVEVTRASNLGLDIIGVEFNRSSNEVEVLVQNTGEPINSRTNISVSVIGGDLGETEQHNVDLSEKEITTLSVPVDRTYPLETLQVSMTNYPVSTESGIKCTPTKGLVGYWTFNQEQKDGNKILDLSGFDNHGYLKYGTSLEEGKLGYAAKFDGVDGFVKINDSSSLNVTEGLTVSARVKPRSSDYDYPRIVTKGYPDGYELLITNSTGLSQFSAKNSTGTDRYVHGNETLFDGKWNQLTGIAGNRIALFEDNTLTEEQKWEGDIKKTGKDLWIGAGSMWSYYRGLIDEVRIYNRSLYEPEIARLNNVKSKKWAVSGCKLAG